MHLVATKKKERRFTKDQQSQIAELVSQSTCKVSVFRSEAGGYLGVHIEFTGPLAHFPSTSNDREIGYLWGKNQFQQRTRRPFIKLTESAKVRLQAAKQAFVLGLCNSGHYPPSFEGEPVHVLALFADKSGRWDSHNMAKPLGDWLEDVGIIDDDSKAAIYCQKKTFLAQRKKNWLDSEYTELAPDPNTTNIIIQPYSKVCDLEHSTFQQMIQVSTGDLKLVC